MCYIVVGLVEAEITMVHMFMGKVHGILKFHG